MERIVSKTEHLVILYDPDYPVCFKILKSGHSDCYSVIEEDPFEHDLKLMSKKETLQLAKSFDPNFSEQDLPKELGVYHEPKDI